MKSISQRLRIYLILFVVSLGVILLYGKFEKWIDIAWWVQLDYLINFDKYKSIYANVADYNTATANAKKIITTQISKRVNDLWVWDAEVKIENRWNKDYVVVKIWWISDIESAKAKIGKTVELEFKILNKSNTLDQTAQRKAYAQAMFEKVKSEPNSFYAYATGKTDIDVYYAAWVIDEATVPIWLKKDIWEIKKIATGIVYDKIIEWIYSTGTDSKGKSTLNEWFFIVKNTDIVNTTGKNWTWIVKTNLLEYIYIDNKVNWIPAEFDKKILNGSYFQQATVTRDSFGKPAINITFNQEWQAIFCDVTSKNVNNQMAIFVWWILTTAPTINQKICGWSAIINWDYTPESAKELSNDLNEWALPAQLILANENKIDATLGSAALDWAIKATILWLIAIFIFMRYLFDLRKSIIAMISLLVFLTILMAIIKIFGYALSLSGISAIILNIWMWVDAAILIFERLREEYKWWDMNQSINIAYDRSWHAIRDGQLSTVAIWLLLFGIGTDVFKWFWLMMIINIWLILLISVPLIKELLKIFYNKQNR